MRGPRIMAAFLGAVLPCVLMATPASAAKRPGDLEMTRNMTPSGLAELAIPLPPPGPFKAPLKPVLSVPPMAMPTTAVPPKSTPQEVEPGAYPPVDFDPEAAATPMPRNSPAPVQTRTPPAPSAGGWQNDRPQANRLPPAYGANPYTRAPQQNWRQNRPQNWQRAPGWPAPNRAYRPYPVQPNPLGQTGRPTP